MLSLALVAPRRRIPLRQYVRDIVSAETMERFGSRPKIIVFGGNGFVGRHIVATAVNRNVDVISISRSGTAPLHMPALSNTGATVEWVKGDIADPESYRLPLKHVDAVISCVGAFGSNERMEEVNGDWNIKAMKAAAGAGIARYVYISATDNNLPSWVLQGYFKGKRRAEECLLSLFPEQGYVLRPGMVYGTRCVEIGGRHVHLPLWIVGGPLRFLLESDGLILTLLRKIPGMKAILAPPISVEHLSEVAVETACSVVEYRVDQKIIQAESLHRVAGFVLWKYAVMQHHRQKKQPSPIS